MVCRYGTMLNGEPGSVPDLDTVINFDVRPSSSLRAEEVFPDIDNWWKFRAGRRSPRTIFRLYVDRRRYGVQTIMYEGSGHV